MGKFEELQPEVRVRGIEGTTLVTIMAVIPQGSDAVTVLYKTADGRYDGRTLFREDEDELEIIAADDGWDLSGDAETFRLVLEAKRIRLAHLFDPYLALSNSSVEPLPHQIAAVYQEMMNRLPLRYVLADDPGAGKTIMTGLFIKELMLRDALERCLIVCPGSLAEQWQNELEEKFHLRFEILSNDRIASPASGNPFSDTPLLIARLDKLARNESLIEKLVHAEPFDLIVCDEAHKMSATVVGTKTKKTRRFELGRVLGRRTEHLLLLTATPHNGKETDFQMFMSLIDEDRFDVVPGQQVAPVDVSDVMRRLTKEELLRFDGTPLFRERYAHTLSYNLAPAERELYDSVTEYVRQEFNRADALETKKRNTVGFALMILQRRLASSPEAIYQSLRRRRARMEERRTDMQNGICKERVSRSIFTAHSDYDEDEQLEAEFEEEEELALSGVTAARTIQELDAEISTLARLEKMAEDVRSSGLDRKWQELLGLLQDRRQLQEKDGRPAKLIVFTEHRDTINYLERQIGSVLGNPKAVVTIHGGLSRETRKQTEAEFRNNPDVQVLLATDAAGEGINLQCAHLMVNYDLPWNPNRIEQRFGRIHRIGQNEVCHLWNFVSSQTREGLVYEVLLDKLEQQRRSLPGHVFDVLGKMDFGSRSFRDLLIDAVRSDSQTEVKERVLPVIDSAFDTDKLIELLKKRALANDTMNGALVTEIRETMERMESRRLQPFFIQNFFLLAMKTLGGSVIRREHGRFEVRRVPPSVLMYSRTHCRQPASSKYERVCFDKDAVEIEGAGKAELICPGHPLLDGLIEVLTEQKSDELLKGTVLINDTDYNEAPVLLFAVEDSVRSGAAAGRVVSKQLSFVEVPQGGEPKDAGPGPHLDMRAPTKEEMEAIEEYLKEIRWSGHDAEKEAKRYASQHISRKHRARVRADTLERVEKTRQAVDKRLNEEIDGLNWRILRNKESKARNAQALIEQDKRRIAELEARLERRMHELDLEKDVSAGEPSILGGALVIPRGKLDQLMMRPSSFSMDPAARRRIERTGMNAVMEIEKSLGFFPTDVSAAKIGWDIESKVPDDLRTKDENMLRFIEVKGRAEGARTVRLTINEVLRAVTNPKQYILAIVEVRENGSTRTTYIRRPFRHEPDTSARSIEYDIEDLKNAGEVILTRKLAPCAANARKGAPVV